MKKIFTLLFCAFSLVSSAQSPWLNPWLTTGNDSCTNKFIGTKDTSALVVKTDSVTRLVIDGTGKFTFGNIAPNPSGLTSPYRFGIATVAIDFGLRAPNIPAMWMGQIYNSTLNWSYSADINNTVINGVGLQGGTTIRALGQNFIIYRPIATSGSNPQFDMFGLSQTNMSPVEIPFWRITPNAIQYSGGTVALSTTYKMRQREITTATTLTVVESQGVEFFEEKAGPGVTMQKKYAATFNGGIRMISTTQGLLPPRMTTAQKNAITVAGGLEKGLTVFDLDLGEFSFYNGFVWKTIASF